MGNTIMIWRDIMMEDGEKSFFVGLIGKLEALAPDMVNYYQSTHHMLHSWESNIIRLNPPTITGVIMKY